MNVSGVIILATSQFLILPRLLIIPQFGIRIGRYRTVSCPFFHTDEMKGILCKYYRLPDDRATKVRLGQVLRYLGCSSKHTRNRNAYNLVKVAA